MNSKSFHFLGVATSTWAFALRNWIAMMLALYVAFWLQLGSASSAATCVAILSLQTRGQVLQKAVFRMAGTVLGVLASFLIASIFSQTRDLFFLACAAWLGLCAFLAGLLDGNRAYGAILSGYTVAIVAVPNVDTPLQTFSSGVNRGAAIMIGILAVAVVNDVFRAPDLFPQVLQKLETARTKIRDFAIEAVRQGGAAPKDVAALMKEVASLHPDITALPTESPVGHARAAAARTMATSLLREISAARVVAAALSDLGSAGEEPRANLVRAFEGCPHDPPEQRALTAMADPDAEPQRRIAGAACLVLYEQDRLASQSLADMRNGRFPARPSRISLYKSREAALRSGLRAVIAVGLASYILSITNWPATVTTLTQVSAFVGLSSTNPNPRGFAVGALIAMPLVVIAVGVTEFLMLDGVDAFPLLAMAMAPTILGASLLLASGNASLYGIGFLLLVFFPVVLSPSNPQNYSPLNYIVSSCLDLTAAVALFILLRTVLPTTPKLQRRWVFASARRELRTALFGPRRPFDLQGSAFRNGDRIGQLSGLKTDGDHDADLRRLIRISDLASCIRRLRAAFSDTAARRDWRLAQAALQNLDVGALRRLGIEMLGRGETAGRSEIIRRAAIDLLFAAVLIDRTPGAVADLLKVATR